MKNLLLVGFALFSPSLCFFLFVCVCSQDLLQRVQKHSEVEMVDLVLKLKDKLVSAESPSTESGGWGRC